MTSDDVSEVLVADRDILEVLRLGSADSDVAFAANEFAKSFPESDDCCTFGSSAADVVAAMVPTIKHGRSMYIIMSFTLVPALSLKYE